MSYPDLTDSLACVVGSHNVLSSPLDLDRYSTDALTPSRAFGAASLLNKTADVVVVPQTAQHVIDIVRLASQIGIPIVPYGGGTGVMGAALPVKGGIVVDLKGLNRILEINPEDRSVTVESGVILEDLGESLEEYGLMVGHDPWSVPIATIGGTISTNGVGYLAAAHGPMGEQVLGLEAVLPSGELLTTPAVPKYSAGPNLNHLLIGAEGVFGIITKATLRVPRIPERRSFITFEFPSFDEGFHAVVELFSLGVRPALVDLTEVPDKAVTLYLMYQGYAESVAADMERCCQVCSSFEGIDIGPEETEDYWNERYDIALSYKQDVQPLPRKERWQLRRWGFDYLHMALPASKVLEYRRRSVELLKGYGVYVREFAIWGRPELFSMMVAPESSSGKATGEGLAEAVDQVLCLAQDMGGAMEYCHGTGVKLAHLLAREWGVGMDVVRAMKKALDPTNIMNPGKLGL